MAKLLCALFLAGFVFQANAYSTEVPELDGILDIFYPSYWISLFNPLNYVPNITDLLNPQYWNDKLSFLPDIINPVTYVRKAFDIFNPFKLIPGIRDWIPFLVLRTDDREICNLPKEEGTCNGYFPRYYFNRNTGQCEKFIYGGCNGNENNFFQVEECSARCHV